MSSVGEREIRTQQRVIAFFRDALGYAYLGHWKDREGNSNVEEALLTGWLKRQGCNDKIIGKVLHELNQAAGLGGSKTLYDANREVYGLLRYGVKVKLEAGDQYFTVWLIDWAHPGNNDFATGMRGRAAERPRMRDTAERCREGREDEETRQSGDTTQPGDTAPAVSPIRRRSAPGEPPATVLSDMNAEIVALEHRRDKTKQIKQGRMQQHLTGRGRLVEGPRRGAARDA